MAVYSELNAQDIAFLLQSYDIGNLVRYEPIASGIENTNYFVWTESSRQVGQEAWVLTVFENIEMTEVPFFTQLLKHLSDHYLLVPAPLAMKQGGVVFSCLQTSLGVPKQGVLVPKFAGTGVESPTVSQCQQIAEFVARMHVATDTFAARREFDYPLQRCQKLAGVLSPLIPQEDKNLLTHALARYQQYWPLISNCRQGVIHGDLFRDNALFDEASLTGVIDFYNASHFACLFDLAVIVNDWVVDHHAIARYVSEGLRPEALYDELKLNALLDAYQRIRPFTDAEKKAWPNLIELAALRFYLSRLKTNYANGYQHAAKAGSGIKSPAAMRCILECCVSAVAMQI